MLPIKNNLGENQTGYAFRVEGARLVNGIETSRVVWDADPVTVTADEALAPTQAMEERSAVEDAGDFLRGLLVDGPVSSRQVRADADGAGHSWAAVRRAQKALGVEVVKAGMRGGWVWRLPPKMLKTAEDAQDKNVSTFGENEHLRKGRRRQATEAEVQELARLVAAAYAQDPEAERDEALRLALADPEAALECYRDIVVKAA